MNSIRFFLLLTTLFGLGAWNVTAQSIHLPDSGWHLKTLGTVTDLEQFFSEYPAIQSIWTWEQDQWAVKFRNSTTDLGLRELTEIKTDQGYWLSTHAETTLNLSFDTAEISWESYDLTQNSRWHLLGASAELDILTNFAPHLEAQSTLWKWSQGEWDVFTLGDEGEDSSDSESTNQINEQFQTQFGNLRQFEAGDGFWFHLPNNFETPPVLGQRSGENGELEWNGKTLVFYERTDSDQLIPVADVEIEELEEEMVRIQKEGYLPISLEATQLEESSVVYLTADEGELLTITPEIDANSNEGSFRAARPILINSVRQDARLYIELDSIGQSVRFGVTPLRTGASLPQPEQLNFGVVSAMAINILDSRSQSLDLEEIEFNGKVEPLLTRFLGDYEGEQLASMLESQLGSIVLYFYDPSLELWIAKGPAELVRRDAEDNSIWSNMNGNWVLRPESTNLRLDQPYPFIAYVLTATQTERTVQVQVTDQETQAPLGKVAVSFNSQGVLKTNSNGLTDATDFTIPPGAPFLLMEVSRAGYSKSAQSILVQNLIENNTTLVEVELTPQTGSVQLAPRVHLNGVPLGGAEISLITPSVLNAEQIELEFEDSLLQQMSVGIKESSHYSWSIQLPNSDSLTPVRVGTPSIDAHILDAETIISRMQTDGVLTGIVPLQIEVEHTLPRLGVSAYQESIPNGSLFVGLKPDYVRFDEDDILLQGFFRFRGDYHLNQFFNVSPLTSLSFESVQWKTLIIWNDDTPNSENCPSNLESIDYILNITGAWQEAVDFDCQASPKTSTDIERVYQQAPESLLISERAFLNRALIDTVMNQHYFAMADFIENDDTQGAYIHDEVIVWMLGRIEFEELEEPSEISYIAIPLELRLPTTIQPKDGVGILAAHLPASFVLPQSISKQTASQLNTENGVSFNAIYEGILGDLSELLEYEVYYPGLRIQDEDSLIIGRFNNPLVSTSLELEPLPIPENLTATEGDQSLTLNWIRVEGADEHWVYCGSNDVIDPLDSQTYDSRTSVSLNELMIDGLTNGAVTYCAVSAVFSQGKYLNESALSPSVEGTPIPDDVFYEVVVEISGEGSVLSTPSGIGCGTECSFSFLEGSSITLTATPQTEWGVGNWSGCDSFEGSLCTIDLQENRTVSVEFTEPSGLEIIFLDEDGSLGEISGNLSISGTNDNSDVFAYNLYWGSDAETRLSIIAEIDPNSPAYRFNASTEIPEGATHLLIFELKLTGEQEPPVFWKIVDTGPPVLSATSLSFTDIDSTGGEIGGTLIIEPASDESAISNYRLYWGSDETTTLQFIVQWNANGEPYSHNININTNLPSSATHFIVVSMNHLGEGAQISLEIEDRDLFN